MQMNVIRYLLVVAGFQAAHAALWRPQVLIRRTVAPPAPEGFVWDYQVRPDWDVPTAVPDVKIPSIHRVAQRVKSEAGSVAADLRRGAVTAVRDGTQTISVATAKALARTLAFIKIWLQSCKIATLLRPAKQWPYVGGTNRYHRMAGPWPKTPPREVWVSAPVTTTVLSWYDTGVRMASPQTAADMKVKAVVDAFSQRTDVLAQQMARILVDLWCTVAERVKEHGPEAGSVFVDIGRGVAVASRESYAIAAAAVVSYWCAFAERVEEHGPEAGSVFVDIGRGVTAAVTGYSKVAAGALVQACLLAAAALYTSKAMALKRDGVAVVAQRVEVQAALSAKMRLLALKRDGLATVAKRTQLEVALDSKRKAVGLRREGAKVAARRAEVAIQLKLVCLKRDGAKLVAQRANLQAALDSKRKLTNLKRDGMKAVVRRAEIQTALEDRRKLARLRRDGTEVIVQRVEVQTALDVKRKKMRLLRDGAATIQRREQIADALAEKMAAVRAASAPAVVEVTMAAVAGPVEEE